MLELVFAWTSQQGLPREDLLETLDEPTRQAVLNAHQGIAWEPYATLLDAVAVRLGERETTIGLARAFLEYPLNSPMRAMLRRVTSPMRIYQLMPLFGRRFMPIVVEDTELRPPYDLRISLRLGRPVGHTSTLFFQIAGEIMRIFPSVLLGTSPAIIESTILEDGTGGDFRLRLPPSRSFFTRAAQLMGIVHDASIAMELLQEQQHAMLTTQDALRQANIDLEARVAERTRELERVNEQLAAAHEDALRSNQLKSNYLANMSHELRTPLTAILGYSELVAEELREEGNTRYSDDLRKVQQSANLLLGLINNIVDLARLEAGRLQLHTSRIHVQEVVWQAIEAAVPMNEANRNTLRTSLPDAPVHLLCDGQRLRQILTNVVGNAARYNTDGQITVSLRMEGLRLSLRVQDNGAGIPPERIPDLFLLHQQINMKRTGGAGLGLPIAHQLALAMGGQLEVFSPPGQGATFTLWLPLTLA
jgi:signal transduction histidine kinase